MIAAAVVAVVWYFTVYTPINFNMGPFATQAECERVRPVFITGVPVSPECFAMPADGTRWHPR